jgi:hypothetical protein
MDSVDWSDPRLPPFERDDVRLADFARDIEGWPDERIERFIDSFQDKAMLHERLQEAVEQAASHMVASLGGRKPEGFEILLAHAHAHDMNTEFYRKRADLLIKELDRRY